MCCQFFIAVVFSVHTSASLKCSHEVTATFWHVLNIVVTTWLA